MDLLPKRPMQQDKYFEEVMVVRPEMFKQLKGALDTYKSEVVQTANGVQTGSGHGNSIGVSLDTIKRMPRFGTDEEERDRVDTMYKMILKYEMQTGKHAAADYFRSMEKLRFLLFKHITKGEPLPKGMTVDTLVLTIRNIEEQFKKEMALLRGEKKTTTGEKFPTVNMPDFPLSKLEDFMPDAWSKPSNAVDFPTENAVSTNVNEIQAARLRNLMNKKQNKDILNSLYRMLASQEEDNIEDNQFYANKMQKGSGARKRGKKTTNKTLPKRLRKPWKMVQ